MGYDARFEQIVEEHTKKWEGGYVNHPNDKGGATNMGITKPFLAQYRGVDPATITNKDMKNLTWDEAKRAYHANVWQGAKIYMVPDALQPLMFNWVTASGPSIPIKFLQKRVGVAADGVIGPITKKAILKAISDAGGSRQFNNELVDEIIRFLIGIVVRDPSQKVFLLGWFNRFSTFYDFGY